MFEPKTDKASRKLAQTQKDLKEKKKKRIKITIVIIVLVIVSVVAITINSSFIRRAIPVVTIDGRGFTAAEFEYFFNAEYVEYTEFMSQFQGAEGFLPDPSRTLSSQVFDPETGETWADYITSMALASMAELVSMYNEAKATGFTLSEEQVAEIEEEMEMVALQAAMGGFPSSDMLLQRMFGNSMNERTYRNIMEFVAVARHYSENVRESFVFSSDSIAAYYAENRDELDAFNYRLLFVDTLMNDPADTYASVIEIANGISSEEDFIEAARAQEYDSFDPDSTLYRMQGGWLDEDIGEWLRADARAYGDITVIQTEYGSSIVFFLSRDDNNYRTVGMRQILISRENVDPADFPEGEYDPEYHALLEQAETILHERAEFANAMFEAMGSTENAMLDLMEEHSDDTTPGGYYSFITKIPYQSAHLQTLRIVPEIEDWLFAEDRSIGDTELIYTAAYGFHLVYFTGWGELFFEIIAEDRMRTRDHSEWINNLTPGEPVKHAAFILVHL